MFPRSNQISVVHKDSVLGLSQERPLLYQKYEHYFFTINSEQYDWIRNPISADAEISTQKLLSFPVKKNFLELRNDRTLRLKFRDIPLDEFWIAVGKEYRQISKKTLEILLQFCTMCLCEQSFSMLVLTKNDKRSCLKEIDRELRVALSNIETNIQRLSSLRQAQVSH